MLLSVFRGCWRLEGCEQTNYYQTTLVTFASIIHLELVYSRCTFAFSYFLGCKTSDYAICSTAFKRNDPSVVTPMRMLLFKSIAPVSVAVCHAAYLS